MELVGYEDVEAGGREALASLVVQIGIGYYNVSRNEWYDYTKKDILNITHWMPTPKLPEEE